MSGCEHTPAPTGYLAWHAWAEEKAKTHACRRCPNCGRWAIWVPKDTVVIEDVRPEVLFRAVCAFCEASVDADGEEYARSPEGAERVALDYGFDRNVDGRLVCENCRPEAPAIEGTEPS